jgi:hypothetical protein
VEARWYSWSEDHIANRGITWAEIEEALRPPIVTERTDRSGTMRVLGQTTGGRLLAAFVAPDERSATVSVITALDMDDSERRTYRRRKGKG